MEFIFSYGFWMNVFFLKYPDTKEHTLNSIWCFFFNFSLSLLLLFGMWTVCVCVYLVDGSLVGSFIRFNLKPSMGEMRFRLNDFIQKVCTHKWVSCCCCCCLFWLFCWSLMQKFMFVFDFRFDDDDYYYYNFSFEDLFALVVVDFSFIKSWIRRGGCINSDREK